MALKTRIDLPAPTRPVGGLLAAARPLPVGWERGVTFSGDWCIAPSPWPYCVGDESPPFDETKDLGVPDDITDWTPMGMFQGVECTVLSVDQAQQDAADTLEATHDWLLGHELQTGEATGNPNLDAGVGVTTIGTGHANALATAEQYLADETNGRLGFIHVTPQDLTLLVNAQVLVREGRGWRTAFGNVVVSSAGYDFIDEIHVTSEVFASVSAVETRSTIDRSINRMEAYAEQIGLAVFPPCVNAFVEVT